MLEEAEKKRIDRALLVLIHASDLAEADLHVSTHYDDSDEFEVGVPGRLIKVKDKISMASLRLGTTKQKLDRIVSRVNQYFEEPVIKTTVADKDSEDNWDRPDDYKLQFGNEPPKPIADALIINADFFNRPDNLAALEKMVSLFAYSNKSFIRRFFEL